MSYTATVDGERFVFADLRELLASANERNSGDELAGIAPATERERVAAKTALADVRVADFRAAPLIDDEVTAVTHAAIVPEAEAAIASLTIGQLRELVRTPRFPELWATTLDGAFLPEVAAAVAKLMSDLDLTLTAKALRTVTRCRNTMGEAGTLGGRIQPSHPTDDLTGILASVVDGLAYACGDAVIGINPVTDSVAKTAQLLAGLGEFTAALEIPTQTCVRVRATTQVAALAVGAPVDLLFQTLAGTEAANRSLGVSMSLLREAREAVLASHRERPGDFVGDQCVYIETGASPYGHHGIDQLTLEARAQGAAKTLDPFLVDSRQITRAGLESHFCGKLQGLPMGAMPGYQSTSYHDVASMRRLTGAGPAPEFARWAESVGILINGEISGSWGEPGSATTDRLARLAELVASRHSLPLPSAGGEPRFPSRAAVPTVEA